MKNVTAIVLAALLLLVSAPKNSCADEEKVAKIDRLTLLGSLAFGVTFWWWPEKGNLQPAHFKEDGWFERKDDWGGADKTGHAFSAYLLSRSMALAYREAGMDSGKAALRASLAGAGIVSLLEVADGFTKYGFSREDIAANISGAGLAYLLETNPTLDRLLDLRWEYLPSEEFGYGEVGMNFVSDYSGMKFHLVCKLDGVPLLEKTPLSFLELHAIYYTRGYGFSGAAPPGRRNLAFGLSVNLSKLFRKWEEKHIREKKSPFAPLPSTIFRYYQAPAITWETANSINDQ